MDEHAEKLEADIKLAQDLDKAALILEPYGNYTIILDTKDEIITKTALSDYALFRLCMVIISKKVEDLAALLKKTQDEANRRWHAANPDLMGR